MKKIWLVSDYDSHIVLLRSALLSKRLQAGEKMKTERFSFNASYANEVSASKEGTAMDFLENYKQTLGLEMGTLNDVPECPGVYLLFADNGEIIYVGKSNNLRKRLLEHFSSNEKNIHLRLHSKYFIWNATDSEFTAEEMEGKIFDAIVEDCGSAPIGNKNAPPKSKYSEKFQVKSPYNKLIRSLCHLLSKAKGGKTSDNKTTLQGLK